MALRKRLLPIGIHLNLEYVHLVQFEQTDDSVHLVSQASEYFAPVDRPLGDTRRNGAYEAAWENRFGLARRFIRQKVTANGFRGKEVVISLPAEHLLIQHVRTAPMQPEELVSALPWELQDKLPYDPRVAVIRHIVAGAVSENNEAKQDVIALVAKRAVVEKYAGAIEKLGLQVTGVGAEPCAMGYPFGFAAGHQPRGQEGPLSQMLVMPAPRTTHVAITRGMETVFVRDVDLGADDLIGAMARAGEQSEAEVRQMRAGWQGGDAESRGAAIEEAIKQYSRVRGEVERLGDELLSCMRYHGSLARGAQIDRVLFLGPEAHDRALVQVVGAQLGLPCEVGDPLGAVTGSSTGARPEMAVAAGLSLFRAQ